MSTSSFVSRTASEMLPEIARGAVSAVEYTRACLDRIAETEPEIGAFAHIDFEQALAQAERLDEHRAAGQALGPLHGVPVGIKDIIDTSDYPTEFGSPMFAGRRPFHDATVVARLRAAGAVIIGKTVTTEFAYFSPGKTRNPHDVTRTPGGSSSGTAAAVAAGMIPVAIGTQTNGSIIRPAAFCGVYAMKPSHGLVSRGGVLNLSRSLDHIGPFARSLEDLGLLLNVLAGYDPADPDTRAIASPDYRQMALEKSVLTPRIAFVRTPVWDKADAAARAAIEATVEKLGGNCVSIDLSEDYAAAWDAQRAVMAVEMAHNLGAFAARGGKQVSDVFHALVAEGHKVSATRYLAALAEARRFKAGIMEIFEECNAIITLSAPGAAPRGLEATGNPVFNSLWTLTGLPAINLPLLQDDEGLPIGLQLVGPAGDDARLLRNAAWLVSEIGSKPKKRRAAKN